MPEALAAGSVAIDQDCPQCGGTVALGESDRILSCPFCRVRLSIVHAGGTASALIAPRDGLPSETIVYAPYWRVKGAVYSCIPYEVRSEIVDTTLRGVEIPGLPVTLGVRPQAMKLRFVSQRSGGRFLRPALAREEAARRSMIAAASLDDVAPLCQRMIGETMSLVYAPLSVRDALYDAVLDRRLGPLPAGVAEEASGSLGSPESGDPPASLGPTEAQAGPRFLSTLCPQCGSDMEGTRTGLCMVCSRCRALWEPREQGFVPLAAACVPASWHPDLYLPFWRIRADVAGVELSSYADLVRFANLPKVVRRGWSERTLAYWVPAFKIHPESLLRCAQVTTLVQPGAEEDALPEERIQPVSLAAEEAMELVTILLASLARPRVPYFQMLAAVAVQALAADLVLVPFQSNGREIRHPGLPFLISTNQLAYGENL
jgi:hypothetical protein